MGRRCTLELEYSYKKSASGDFAATLEAIARELPEHGFVLEHHHDLQATLASKGFPIQPLCILEISLEREEDPSVRRLMPCRLNIYCEDGDVVVAALKPSLVAQIFPELGLDDAADLLETRMTGLVDAITR